ncbi:hypothetical protein [Neobacillus sp. Marseille-QA0830]
MMGIQELIDKGFWAFIISGIICFIIFLIYYFLYRKIQYKFTRLMGIFNMAFFIGIFFAGVFVLLDSYKIYKEDSALFSSIAATSTTLIAIGLSLALSSSQSLENELALRDLSGKISQDILKLLFNQSSPQAIRDQLTEKTAHNLTSKINSNSIKKAIAKEVVKQMDLEGLKKEIAKEIAKKELG